MFCGTTAVLSDLLKPYHQRDHADQSMSRKSFPPSVRRRALFEQENSHQFLFHSYTPRSPTIAARDSVVSADQVRPAISCGHTNLAPIDYILPHRDQACREPALPVVSSATTFPKSSTFPFFTFQNTPALTFSRSRKSTPYSDASLLSD